MLSRVLRMTPLEGCRASQVVRRTLLRRVSSLVRRPLSTSTRPLPLRTSYAATPTPFGFHKELCDRILAGQYTEEDAKFRLPLSGEDLAYLVAPHSTEEDENLFRFGGHVTNHTVGNKVYYRGLIEFSNVCSKNCMYCGIRRDMKVHRYTMKDEEIIECAKWAHKHRYGSICLQSGELPTVKRVGHLVDLIKRIKKETNVDGTGGVGITLCIGELTKAEYKELFDAGAHRYLLRIETSNPQLYRRMHPEDHDWERRVQCLRDLKEIGYQMGTGVMIGLPHQTYEDMANDILFFEKIGADMIGMGPYIHQSGTPMGDEWLREHEGIDLEKYNEKLLHLGCRMIALTRMKLPTLNIASTTALQALSGEGGRELGMYAGANILMPIITPTKYRYDYQLYEGKPCLDDTAGQCKACLWGRVTAVGKEVAYGDWGDAPHYFEGSHPLYDTTQVVLERHREELARVDPFEERLKTRQGHSAPKDAAAQG